MIKVTTNLIIFYENGLNFNYSLKNSMFLMLLFILLHIPFNLSFITLKVLFYDNLFRKIRMII